MSTSSRTLFANSYLLRIQKFKPQSYHILAKLKMGKFLLSHLYLCKKLSYLENLWSSCNERGQDKTNLSRRQHQVRQLAYLFVQTTSCSLFHLHYKRIGVHHVALDLVDHLQKNRNFSLISSVSFVIMSTALRNIR